MANNYSKLGELFQQIALGSNSVAELTFDIEKATYGRRAATIDCAPPIFVAGMARAGTTALLRALYAQEMFATLTFVDMPFLLAPNLWNRLSKGHRRDIARKSRGQNDGILQNLDSPEALEEAFWRVFDGNNYIKKQFLKAYIPPAKTLKKYKLYVKLILLRYGGRRYLAKNNNNVLRLAGLLQAFPDAKIVHPFRDPLQHVGSLMHHNVHAVESQTEDRFKLSYMNHLAHHEFGSNHRPFSFPGKPLRTHDTMDPNYWLGHWIDLHSFLLEQPKLVRQQQQFIDIDAAADCERIANGFISRLIDTEPKPYPIFRKAIDRKVNGLDPVLIKESISIYREMQVRSL